METVPLRRARRGPPVGLGAASIPSHDAQQLERALRERVRGEVRFDRASLALYATDASNYRHVPIGVVLPKDIQDVVAAVGTCSERGVPLLSRGAGTSLAGQCCNVAVVLDFSKYLGNVLEVDPQARIARVEPGTILDEVRALTEPHGLTFGPDPSTHGYCTIGGMIGNNSCGTHSVLAEFYGPGPRVAHNVESLEVLTYDGLRLRVGATSDAELEAIIAAGGRRAEIYGKLRALRDRHASALRRGFPDIQRRVSGYDLPALLPENGFNVAAALTGTESTCVTILEAVIRLCPRKPERALIVAGYPSVYDAADDAPRVRELRPVGLEGMDDKLVKAMKERGLHPDAVNELPEGAGFLFVELGADTNEELRAAIDSAMRLLGRGHRAPHAKLFEEREQQEKLWQVREAGLGATAFVPGAADTWEGWEDAGLPVDRLGDYLRQFRKLLDRYAYDTSMYGHFGQGCVHCRINFDLTTPEGIAKYRSFTSEAADLVVSFGGSLSGEHGDGQSRGELLEKMYGRELVQAMREFKAIWDPRGLMNPGKVVDARPRDADLRLGAAYDPWKPATHFAYAEDAGDFSHAALRCVGVGKCRRLEGGTMCPSFMATREELHTTRGRAHMLFEMMRGDVIRDRWQSEEVKQALELCLSCKGCKSDCPVNVDIATYKAEFLSHYYEHRLRPRHAYAFGLIHRWARIGSLAPGLVNTLTHAPGFAALAKLAAGVAPKREIPRFARRTFRSWFLASERARHTGASRVLLWPDTFNNYFYPQTLVAAVEVLEQAGYSVDIPDRPLCCGRPLYDYGMLVEAKRLWQDLLSCLADDIDAGVHVVGVEPSCVASFRDELPGLFPDDPRAKRISENTLTIAELLAKTDGYEPPRFERKAYFHGHCQHKAIMKIDAELALLERMGVECEVPEPGCCGMAGAFGFEKEKYDVSVEIGERALLPALRGAPAERMIVADGFSCREQVRHGAGRRPLHLVEVIQLALHQDEAAGEQQAEGDPERMRDRLVPKELVRAASPPVLVLLSIVVAVLVAFISAL